MGRLDLPATSEAAWMDLVTGGGVTQQQMSCVVPLGQHGNTIPAAPTSVQLTVVTIGGSIGLVPLSTSSLPAAGTCDEGSSTSIDGAAIPTAAESMLLVLQLLDHQKAGGAVETLHVDLIAATPLPVVAHSSDHEGAVNLSAQYAAQLRRNETFNHFLDHCVGLERHLQSSISSQLPHHQQTHTTPALPVGIPAAFANRSSAPLSDLAPAGGDGGFTRGGAVAGGPPNGNAAFGAGGGSAWIGPNHPVFGAVGPQQQLQDPSRGLARFDPPFPGNIRGGVGGFGVMPSAQVFPGDPDADHLRPWTNGSSDDPFAIFPRGGRGGAGRGGPSHRGGMYW